MASVAHQIFTLLGVDPQSPQAESAAKDRLKALNIHGMKCRRCDGTGKYRGGRAQDAVCFGCNGRGAAGIALTKLALQQLEGMVEKGTLSSNLRRWKGLDMLRDARQDVFTRCNAIGIEGLYNAHNARHKPVGDWNRDLYDFHAKLKTAYRRVDAFPGADNYTQMCKEAQDKFCQNFQRTYAYALRSVEAIKAELDEYVATHEKPNFRKECLAVLGLEMH